VGRHQAVSGASKKVVAGGKATKGDSASGKEVKRMRQKAKSAPVSGADEHVAAGSAGEPPGSPIETTADATGSTKLTPLRNQASAAPPDVDMFPAEVQTLLIEFRGLAGQCNDGRKRISAITDPVLER